jgi:GTP-binding protein EngB required for normal cell division
MGGNVDSSNYYLNINMIGEDLYLFYLYLCKNIYTERKADDIKEKNSIFDFWDFNYKYNTPIEQQINYVFSIYEKNRYNIEINTKEALIVYAKNKNSEIINKIFTRMQELKRPHYMPLVLFLLDEYDESIPDNKIIPDIKLYPNIIPTTIYTAPFINNEEYLFESKYKELTKIGEKKMKLIKNILLRFCSYHNDLGDIFSIGEKDKVINYDLTKEHYPFTINICCIGRFGKGKSTCVNCLLGETKAKESKSGASTTKKVSYYQISDQPITIYDIPGFESKETTDNAVNLLKELKNEIDESKKIHIILYIIKSTDDRIFADLELDMLVEISKQNNLKLLYILTHSAEDMDKKIVIDKINVGMKSLLRNNEKKVGDFDEIFKKLKADLGNCIFVNFYQEEKNPIYGIRELFLKLGTLVKELYFDQQSNNNIINDSFILDFSGQAFNYLISRALKVDNQP